MTVRIYVPTTLPGLRELLVAGALPEHADRVAAAGDDEEAEYAALMAAADASAALLSAPGRRVVVVAEVAAPGGRVPLRDVVAVHCDTEDRPPGADRGEDLAWFASQEIPDLI